METNRKWWLQPQRMIQTNLREIDADLDPDRLIADLKSFGATVLMFNTGGIVASYPSDLPFHYPNPYLKSDLVGEVLERCHANGIRYFARMDFSKANRAFYGEHPDWFYRTAAGTVVDYNGQLHTCVNGQYQSEHALAIVEEVLDRYPIDGIFFNMFGYQTWDYSRNYHGICHCDNCRRLFREKYGHDLPKKEDPSDPVYRLHQTFRRNATKERLDSIVSLIRSKRPDVAISGVDWIRQESNSSVDRPLPHWIYEACAQAKSIMDSWPKRAVANAAVHFLDIPYRHVSVPPYLTALRMAQNLASGAWIDFYCISTLDRQEDRLSFDLMKEIYHFHRDHADEYYTGLEPAAKAAVLVTGTTEYRGIFRMFVESHIPFDVLEPDSIKHGPPDLLDRYALIAAPDPSRLSQDHLAALDDYVQRGGRLLATGRLPVDGQGFAKPTEGSVQLDSLGVAVVREFRDDARAAYFKMSDRELFPSLAGVDITFLDEYYQHCDLRSGARPLLKFVPPCMYGPPEKCYYEEVTDEPGIVIHPYGQGVTAVFPWPVGTLYYKYSSVPHRLLFTDTVEQLLGVDRQLTSNASEMVMFTINKQPHKGGRLLLHLVNSSGHHGTAFHAPVPMENVEVALQLDQPCTRVRALKAGADLEFAASDGWCRFTIPSLDLFEAVSIE